MQGRRRAGSGEPAGNCWLESPLLKVPFSQSHWPDPRAETDSHTQPRKLLKTQLTGSQTLFSGWGRAQRSCDNPQVSWRQAILHGAPKGPKVLNQHTAHTPTPSSSPPASDDLAHAPNSRPALTQTLFFFEREDGKRSSRIPTEFSLWFPGLKVGSASGLGAGRRSRGPGAMAREKGVSGA